MNLHDHAVNELSRLDDGSEEQAEVNKDILKIVDDFSSQGHSGFSASYTLNLLTRLLKFYPIKPITNSEDEWGKWQGPEGNKSRQACRYSALFQNEDGSVYDINRISKQYEDHMDSSWYGPNYYVKLPYLPNPDEHYNIVVPKEFWPDESPRPTAEEYASFTDDEELKKHILNKI
jgi:hypothetical protein